MLEIDSLQALRARLRDTSRPEGGRLDGVVLQGLDLRGQADLLRGLDLRQTTFLGCQMDPELSLLTVGQGALVFPVMPELPFLPYRPHLYAVEELYDGFNPDRPDSYSECLDARIYQHWKARGGASPRSILDSLAQRLHDHAISDALEEFLHPSGQPERRVVAIMGGHSMRRDDPAYRSVAWVARALCREGFLMASGGGPGAMEATHLGTWLAPHPDDALDPALEILAQAPGFEDPGWLSRAFEVRRRFAQTPAESARFPGLGVPTWLYGHEPPNAFATHHAKYFANCVREEGLLSIARHGVVYTPGSAGTFQEVFQDACQNHYLTCGVASPMVFFGRDFWTRQRPLFPLLEQLASGKAYAEHLSIHDDPAQVVEAIARYAARH